MKHEQIFLLKVSSSLGEKHEKLCKCLIDKTCTKDWQMFYIQVHKIQDNELLICVSTLTTERPASFVHRGSVKRSICVVLEHDFKSLLVFKNKIVCSNLHKVAQAQEMLTLIVTLENSYQQLWPVSRKLISSLNFWSIFHFDS